jgi:hypothetical protein
MADISIATLTPKNVKKFDGAAGGINPNGENGIAVEFMTIVVFLVKKKLIFFSISASPPPPMRMPDVVGVRCGALYGCGGKFPCLPDGNDGCH